MGKEENGLVEEKREKRRKTCSENFQIQKSKVRAALENEILEIAEFKMHI